MKILIIGGGAAGMSAAVTAAESGADVTVWESSKNCGGNGRFAEGVFAAGSSLQKRLNIDADPAKLFREAMEFSHWRSDARLTRALINASGETVDWLASIGVPFCRVIHHMVNQSPEVFHMTAKTPTGRFVMERLLLRAESLKIKISTETRAEKLIIRDNRVCGAISDKGDSCEAEAVLISTGGITGDAALIHELMPSYEPHNFMRGRGICHNGDGLRLARQAGAEPQRDLAIEGAGPAFCGSGPVGALVRSAEAIWLNRDGERFCDESIVDNFIFGQNALARQPEKRGFAVFDSSTVARAMASAPGAMADSDATDNGFSMLPIAIENAIADGNLYSAGTLAELAEKSGIPFASLCNTLAEYNTACALGTDPIFDKPKRCLFPINKPPFYAARAGLDMLSIHGGIAIDRKMRVLNRDYRPIPGLYCAGLDASGIDSCDYSVALSGHAFGFALAGGRMAAKNMISE